VRRLKRQPDEYALLTPNQLIAFNLKEVREEKGWTQEKAAEELATFLGRRWSKASYSAAERSVDTPRIKQFSADELVAMCFAFNVPMVRFFAPPTRRVHGRPVRIRISQNAPAGAEIDPGGFVVVIIRQYGREEKELDPEIELKRSALYTAIVSMLSQRLRPYMFEGQLGVGATHALIETLKTIQAELGLEPEGGNDIETARKIAGVTERISQKKDRRKGP
jgi:transcriptional regulator with XRE-family HTH domain